MNNKLTPEQAVEMCQKYAKLALSVTNKEFYTEIAALIESLTADAELGRAAAEAVDKIDTDYGSNLCSEPIFDNSRSCQSCNWQTFCRLRAGRGEEDK